MAEVAASSSSEFAAFVGLDWADQKHDVALVEVGASRCEQLELVHSAEAIDAWACGLRTRFAGKLVAVCFEETRGAIAYALLKYDFLVLFPLPPARLTRYREAFTSSGAKDDTTDAGLLLDYLLRHRDCLRVWRPDASQTRELRLLAEFRRDAVDQRTRVSNQLTAVLKLYFPQALQLLGENLHAGLACDFLSKWTTLEAAQKASADSLRKFYWSHNCRSGERVQERLDLVKSAIPLTRDEAIILSSVLRVRCLVGQLRALTKSIADYELRIKQLMHQHPDASLFTELPGAGPALAPRLLVAFGTDRERFGSAQELQTLSGVAPVTKRSGKRCTIHRRWACPQFLLQTFHEFAYCSTRKSTWAAAFYAQQRAAGKGRHAALRTLAFKWIRILFRCWKTRTAYSEDKYLEALRKRNAPLIKFLNQPPTNPNTVQLI